MNSRKFSEAMNELDYKYVEEAARYRNKRIQTVWVRWGALAACVCMMLVGGVLFLRQGGSTIPDPAPVEIPDPVLEVASVEEMQQYLDFDIPVLDKEIGSCSVLIENSYPVMGQIDYADGSVFRMRYGSGDISGIYGGTLEESRETEGITVGYYRYGDIAYAVWEQGGFAFSYVYTGNGSAEVEALIRQYK